MRIFLAACGPKRLSWFRVAVAWAFIPSVAGCGGEDPTRMDPSGSDDCSNVFMRVTAGEDQLGRPGQALGAEVEVRVTDPSGTPVPGAGECVEWTVMEGGGSVSGSTTTDASGAGRAVWTLGRTEGVQVLRAKVGSAATRDVYAVALERIRPIVFVADPRSVDQGGDGGQLFLMEEDGTAATPLTTGVYVDEGPKWSPDGNRIAFLRRYTDTCSPLQGDVVIINLVSLISTRITADGDCAEAFGVDWSPDGGSVALSRDNDLIRISVADGSRSTVVGSAAREIRPAWGPEGIAYSRDTGSEDAKTVHLTTDTGEGDQVLGDGSNDFNVDRWAPDGTILVIFHKAPAGSLNWSLWTYALASGAATRVEGSTGGTAGSLSPDGSRMIATIRSDLVDGSCNAAGADHLVDIDLTTGDQAALTEVCGTPSRSADWRPTG